MRGTVRRLPARRGRPATGLVVVLAAVAWLAGCEKPPTDPASVPDDVASLRDALRRVPDDASLRLRLARLYLSNDDPAAAESQFRHAVRLGVSDPALDADLARSLIAQERHFEALTLIDARLGDGVEMPARLWLLRGEAQLGLPSFNRDEIRRSFGNAYDRLRDAPDPIVAARLKALAVDHDDIGIAIAHLDCDTRKAARIEPQFTAAPVSGRVLRVGPGRRLTRISQAAAEARDGDLVEIDAGVYRGDVAVWRQNNLVLRGVGGLARLEAAGQSAQEKAIWVFDGDNITAEYIAFSGAKVRHRNGAGIRLHGTDATIRNCHFHDNENGILGGNDPDNDVLVEFSTFERNGYGDGLSHNMYIGRARSFTLRYSFSHAAHIGHLVKSRAYRNVIAYNRIVDGDDGDGSYAINLPEGGRAFIVGNELSQGPRAENPIMISIGEEVADRDDQAFFVVNNTFYNRVLEGTIIRNATDVPVIVANNLLAGAPALLIRGEGQTVSNTRRPEHGMFDPLAHDYRLVPGAPSIDAGIDTATIDGLEILPDARYEHPARGRERLRVAAIDTGAHEFCQVPQSDATE